MHRQFKQFMTLVLALVMMLSVAIPAFAAGTIESSKSTTVTVKMGERNTFLKDQNGKAVGGSYWEYTTNKDSVKGPAYCINHGLKAVPSNKALPIKSRYDASPKVLGAFANGYPQVKLSDFIADSKLTDLTESEFEYATQLAVWAALGQLGVEGTQFTSGSQQIKNPTSTGDAQQIRVFKALQFILAGASTWTQNQWRGMYMRYREGTAGGTLEVFHQQGLAGLAAEGTQVQLETIGGVDYYTVVYYVSSATPTKPNGNTIDVTPYGPAGTILADMNNNPLESFDKGAGTPTFRVPTTGPVKTDLNANGVEYVGKYKLCIPADNAAASGTVELVSSAEVTQYELYIAYNEAKTEQSYIIADPSSGLVYGKGAFIWSSEETEEGALQVTKTDGQGLPLSGATFELRGASGYSESQTTSDDGTVLWESLDPTDTYTLVETVAPAGYAPRDPMQVSIGTNITTYVTIRNDNACKLFIRKLDKQNNRVLQGAVFELKQIDGSFQTTGVTQFDGILEFGTEELPFGSYEVRELSAPEGYLRDTSVQTVHWDGTADMYLNFLNIRVPGITLNKVSESGEPLMDAVFNVYKDGQVIRSVTTDFNGEARFEITESGEGYYEFEEITAPFGYVLDSTKIGIHFDPYNPATQEDPVVIAVNKAKPHLQIIKLDANTGAQIAGVTFEVYKNTALVGSYVTGSDGEVLISVDPGVYLVKEVGVPEGYVLNTMPQEIEILAGDGVKQLVFLNDPKPGLYILKVDELTGDFLANAEFSVELNGGQIIWQGLTDNTGIIYLENLEPGWYTVRELAAPHGYIIRDDHKDVLLEPGKVVQVKFDNRPRPKLEILKVDTVTRQPLAGAKFKVTKTEDKTVSEYITGADGRILIENLDEAVYTVEEITAPDGYILNPQHKEIALEWGKTKTLVYEDTRKPTLVITKTDGLTYQPIPDTTYRIEYEHTNGGVALIDTYRTDKNGQVILRNAEVGWYVITETLAAPGYNPSSNPVQRKYLTPGENSYTNFSAASVEDGIGGDVSGNNIRVTSGDDYIVGYEIINYPLNSIVIRKADAVTGELLAGAVFELRQVNENVSGTSGTLIGRYTTDHSGTIVITGLTPGGYIVEEVKAPANYMLSENSMQQVWLKADGTSIVEATFANYPYGGLLITKVDTLTNKPLPNARFKVTDSSGAVVGNTNGEYITDAAGEIMIPNVKPGSYVITELEAPENYVIDTTPQTITIGVDGKIYKVSFKNQPAGALTILKLDTATREPLAGAEFKVTDSTGAVVGTGNGKYTTDATGQIIIPNLPKGSYIVQETKAPDGYILENQQQTIAVDYGKTYTLEFFNKKMSGLQIIKIDSVTKQPLKGAEFTVYKQSGEIVDRYVTDADGVIIIDTLSPGWYKVVETKTLDGYVLDETPKDVLITANQFVKVVFENAPMSGLIIRKVDADTREPLEGAEFTVRTAGGLLIGVYRSGTDGTARIPELAPGWYTVTETKAPEGYTLGDNVQTVQITNSKTVTLEFQNRPFGSLVIKKVDEITGDPLTGATFEVHKQGGGFVGEYTTDVTGTISILSVEPGWYVVSETKAPAGYTLNSTAKTVEVKSGVPSITTFANKPLSGIQILKLDAVTNAPLSGAVFTIVRVNGERVGDKYTTDVAGKILVPDLTEGVYIISEIQAPAEYVLDAQPQTVEVKSGKLTIAEFTNTPYPYLHIVKTDASTGRLLYGAEFVVTNSKGEVIANVISQSGGAVSIKVAPGVYTITEVKAPAGYELSGPVQSVEVRADGSAVYYGTTTAYPGNTAWFANRPLNTLQIVKLDSITHNPLANAIFKVEKVNGGSIGTFRTDLDGSILISSLTEGTYVVSEIAAPTGYILSESPKNVTLSDGRLVDVMFFNKPLSGIEIVKLDAVTHQPLQGAAFTVTKANGERIGTFRTEADGKVLVTDLDEGVYVVGEITAPDGYQLDETPKNVTVKSGQLATVEFNNKPYSGIEIIKTDAVSHKPLSGATFEVKRANGEKIGTYKTDVSGKAIISDLTEGTYIVSETIAPDNYILDNTPQTVTVKSGRLATVDFVNKPFSGIEIRKVDSTNGNALPGAVFEVRKQNGEYVTEVTTDVGGKASIANIEPGWYVLTETKAPQGYVIDGTAKTVEVKSGAPTVITFSNKPLSGLKIVKLNSATRQPIAGVEFAITKMSGEKVTNEFNSTTFKTDSTGQIYIPGLADGYYIVTETRSADGYILDAEPKTVQVQSGKPTVLEVLNTPMSGLLIVKTDAATGKPLAGVVFDVKRADGQFVAGSILDGNQPNTEANSPNKTTSPNGDITGSYTTDANGRILINGLPAGEYHVTERKALDGYELDTDVHAATVTLGKLTTLQITNKQMAGLRLLKIDSITKKPIFGVEFMVFDSNNKVVGTYVTDNNGLIDFTGILTQGRYTIRETRAAAGYYLDDMPRTVEFVSGKITEVRWENTPQQGQIQITKKSGDANEVNGLPAGTPLAGAVFEVYDYKTGNLLDRFSSGTDGRAVSKPLPLGRYTVKEVQAPQYYRISTQTLDIEIEFATQIIKQEFLNYSANTGVYIKKTGNVEAMPGDTIAYTIKEVKNTSTVPLTDFYWRDILPVDAVRLTKIVTGTFNQSLKYKVIVTTNKGDTRVIADNLSTTKNNVIDCSNASLGLRNDEFITSVTFVFGTVKAGFCQVEQPQIFVKVLSTLPNGYQFSNKCDVGGKYGSEWVVSNSTWLTTIYAKPGKLPRTGY